MRVVLDTNVIAAAMRSPRGASAGLLRAIVSGHAILVLSAAMALEYEAVCTMPQHGTAAGLTEAEVLAFVDGIVALAEPVIMRFLWRPQLRDPNGEMVLETAVNGKADVIVTFNGRDFVRAPAQFGIEVLKPVEVLRRLSQ
jgi:putative PIN family toxin of toxin-antitoxin system